MKNTALPSQPTTAFCSNLFPGKTPAILSLLLALLILPSIGAAQPFADDFNDGNDNGWTRYDPLGGVAGVPFVHYSFPNGAYRIQADASPNAAYGPGRGASLRVSTTYTDFYEAADIVAWNSTLPQAFGLLAHVTNPGLGSTLGYAFTYQEVDHNISIAKITGEDGKDISGTSKPVTLDPAKSYRFVFIGKGANLEGRVYELPDTRHAIATTSTTESSYPNGINGLLVYDNSSAKDSTADATFDNFLALDIEPPELTLAVGTFGELQVSWTSDSTAFQLQQASTVPSTNWITIPPGEIFTQGNQSTYTTEFQPTNTFFRLLRP
jgi:hypothetical protein